MALKGHHINSVLSNSGGSFFVSSRKSVAEFVRQLPKQNSVFLALFVSADQRLLKALSIDTWRNSFPADEIAHITANIGAAGIVLVHVGPVSPGDWNAARTASSALKEACREIEGVLLDCLFVFDEQVHSLTGLNMRARLQKRS